MEEAADKVEKRWVDYRDTFDKRTYVPKKEEKEDKKEEKEKEEDATNANNANNGFTLHQPTNTNTNTNTSHISTSARIRFLEKDLDLPPPSAEIRLSHVMHLLSLCPEEYSRGLWGEGEEEGEGANDANDANEANNANNIAKDYLPTSGADTDTGADTGAIENLFSGLYFSDSNTGILANTNSDTYTSDKGKGKEKEKEGTISDDQDPGLYLAKVRIESIQKSAAWERLTSCLRDITEMESCAKSLKAHAKEMQVCSR